MSKASIDYRIRWGVMVENYKKKRNSRNKIVKQSRKKNRDK